MGAGWQPGRGAGAGHHPLGTSVGWNMGAPSGVLGANPSYGLGQEKQGVVQWVPMLPW